MSEKPKETQHEIKNESNCCIYCSFFRIIYLVFTNGLNTNQMHCCLCDK